MAVLRSSLVRWFPVGAVFFLPGGAFTQDTQYRLGFVMPSRWIDPSVQQFYLAPDGSAPGLAFTQGRCAGGNIELPGGVTQSKVVWCTLTTPLVPPASRIHGWSISVRAAGARLVSARSTFAEKAEFERTELTSGEGNQGVVSTVVLSQGFPGATAASGGTFPVASIVIETTVPKSGCVETDLRYEDGLRDSMGAVIENELLLRGHDPRARALLLEGVRCSGRWEGGVRQRVG